MTTIQFKDFQIALNDNSLLVIVQEDAGLFSGLVSEVTTPETTYADDVVSYISTADNCTTIALQTPTSVLAE